MLREVLALFEQAETPLCLDDVAARLGKPPSVVEGMLELLVRKGKLVEVPRSQRCDVCPVEALCQSVISSRRFFSPAPHTTRLRALN